MDLTALPYTYHARVDSITYRPSRTGQPGGALNANWSTVDAIAIVCAKAGNLGLKYGEDFWWEGTGSDILHFRFKDEKYIMMLGLSI